MEENSKQKSCKQDKCNVVKDGKCLEGLAYEECPHFSWVDGLAAGVQVTETKKRPTPPQVQLASGEEWTLSALKELTNKVPAKKVYIIGDSDCGKTTLLVRLFTIFQFGRFGKFQFAGSTTLVGFERRIHLSKVESKKEKEQTEKTKSHEFSFLHLALKTSEQSDSKRKHLLFSDISGERLQLARNSTTEMTELALLRNADFILIMIDGEKVAEKKTRYSAIINSQTFLRQALDDGVISVHCKVRIVLSKWDLLATLPDFDYEEQVVKPFEIFFRERIPKLKFICICSRSRNRETSSSYGIESLLQDLTEDEFTVVDRSQFSTVEASPRAFSNYFFQPKNNGQ